MRRNGQAALEFLTTYGWALLIILVMIGAISYFGILNPSKLLPSTCTVSSELSCVDYQIKDQQPSSPVLLQLKQGVGKTIYLSGMSCTYGSQTAQGTVSVVGSGAVVNPGDAWSPRDTLQFQCLMPSLNGLRGSKVKVLYNLTYLQSSGGFAHTSAGEIYTEVQ